jgi:hypothetical protein
MTKVIKQQARIRTNTQPGSVCKIAVDVVKFSSLWDAYPSSDPCNAKDKDGEPLFGNQCAIRLSFAMKKAGVTFKSYLAKRKCWVHPEDDHVLAAKELADWLELQPFVGCRKSESIAGENWRDKIVGRTGIVCFEDYYAPSHGSGGDHIDLWNKDKLTGGFVAGWARARFNIVIPGRMSDLRKSKKIGFFPIT